MLTKNEYLRRTFDPARTNKVLKNQKNLRKYCFVYDPLLFKERGVTQIRFAVPHLHVLPGEQQNYILVHVYANEIDQIMAWRDLLVVVHPDLIYAHNCEGYDNPMLFTRTNYLTGDIQTVQSSSKKALDEQLQSDYFPCSFRQENGSYYPRCPHPKTPYRHINRRLFEPATFKRKASESTQKGVIERFYLDLHGYSGETDTMLEIKNLKSKRKTWALNPLAEDELNDHKADIGNPRMNACFRERYFWPIIAYCDYDTVLPIALVQHLGVTIYNATFGQIAHCSIDRICKFGLSSSVTMVFLMEAYARGFVMETNTHKTPKWLKGSQVFDGQPKLLPCLVPTLDFEALYPNEADSNNLCMTTTMRPLDNHLEPIDFGDWKDTEWCERQLREWDVRRGQLYGDKFIPPEFKWYTAGPR